MNLKNSLLNVTIAVFCLLAMGGWLLAAEPVNAGDASNASKTSDANNPGYDQQGLWPEDVKKTAYYAQKWEPARLLVWARTEDYTGSLKDPANWLENGKPAQKEPDDNSDLVFPDAPKQLLVAGGTGDWQTWETLKMRHLTIGRNIKLRLRNIIPSGNVWVKENVTWNVISIYWEGDKDTFARNDSKRIMLKIPHVRKIDKASVETVGPWGNADGLYVDSGTMILGTDSSWWAGDRHQNTVCSNGTLILMSGSTLQIWRNKDRALDLDIYGVFQAGTADRPLTRDANFPLCFKSRGRLEWKGETFGDARDVGLLLRAKGTMAVYSSDPTKARLVFSLWRDEKTGKNPKMADGKVQVQLLGKTELNGVLFDDFDLGGIELADLGVRDTWKNIQYGKNNAGKPDELYKKVAGKIRSEQDGYK